MKSDLNERQINNKTEFKKLSSEIKSLRDDNVELMQKIAINQNKIEDLEIHIGLGRKFKNNKP